MVGHTGYAVDSEDLSQSTNATLSLVKQKEKADVSIANLASIQEETRCQAQAKLDQDLYDLVYTVSKRKSNRMNPVLKERIKNLVAEN